MAFHFGKSKLIPVKPEPTALPPLYRQPWIGPEKLKENRNPDVGTCYPVRDLSLMTLATWASHFPSVSQMKGIGQDRLSNHFQVHKLFFL